MGKPNQALVDYLDGEEGRLERLAARVQVHVATIYRWCRGSVPHRRIRKLVAAATKGAVGEESWS